MRSGIGVTVGAAFLALAGAAVAGNGDDQQSRPKPACSAAVLGDPRGDVENAGLDLVGAFLTQSGGDVFANLVISDLNGVVDQKDSTQEYFNVRYRTDRGHSLTRWARLYGDGKREGATWFDGADGIVQILLPKLTPGTPTTLSAETGAEREVARVRSAVSDEAEQDLSLRLFEVKVDQLAPASPTTVCPPKPPPAAAKSPVAEPAAESTVTAGRPRLRGRTMRIPLRSTTRVTDLRGRLTRDGRLIARGRLAELDGRGVLVLTARRGFRPGIYLLSIPGVLERRVRIG